MLIRLGYKDTLTINLTRFPNRSIKLDENGRPIALPLLEQGGKMYVGFEQSEGELIHSFDRLADMQEAHAMKHDQYDGFYRARLQWYFTLPEKPPQKPSKS
jgi:hypothetical protein